MIKKMFVIFIVLAFVAPLYAATNARIYALGYAYYTGDILVSVPQGWQILSYPDQVQGGADLTGQKPGPVVMVKSLGENFAIGASVNTFERRTKGSTMFSKYYQRSIIYSNKWDPDNQTFPNFPQLNFAFKIAEQKFGINLFYETQKFDKSKVTPSNQTDYLSSEEEGRTSVIGGCFTARLGGNFGWNPWVRFGLPILESKDVSTTVWLDTAVNVLNRQTQTIVSKNVEDGSRNLMYNAGSCFDYTFGDVAWAIVGAWYRNEQYAFVQTNTDTAVADVYSPKWDHNYLEYFAAVTPKVFGNLMLGIEYQGAYFWDKTMVETKRQTGVKKDTTNEQWFNSFIIAMELPIKVKKIRCLDTFTPRGSLRYNIGKGKIKTETEDPSNPGVIEVYEEWMPVSTKNDEMREGMMLCMGFGLTKGRVTIDVSTNVIDWYKMGMLTLPPATHLTVTTDFHRLRQ